MPTTIINKLGTGVPSASSLSVGEIAQDKNTGALYVKRLDGEVVEVSSDGAGAGMVISAVEPADPVDGMQWLESTTAIVWIWDEDKWLEFPAGKGDDSVATYTLPVSVRGGDIQLPLNEDSTKLVVDTRGGPVELPLMAA
jgi:hypothetical protein